MYYYINVLLSFGQSPWRQMPGTTGNRLHIWLKSSGPNRSFHMFPIYIIQCTPTYAVHFCTISKLIPTHVPCILYTLLLTITLSRHQLSLGFWPGNKSALADYFLKGYLASLRTNIG